MARVRQCRQLAGVVAMSIALAACSASGEPPTSGAGGTTATGPVVKIMIIATRDHPALNQEETFQSAQARVSYINTHGGLSGHKLELIECDLGLDPNQEKACLDKAVSEKVSAVVGAALLFNTLGNLQSAQIPIVLPQGTTQAVLRNPISYPNAGSVGWFAGIAAMAARSGDKSIMIDVANVGSAQEAGEIIENGLEAQGINVLGTLVSSQTSTDESANAAALIQRNPDGIAVVTGGPALASTIKSLREQGYEGHIYTTNGLLQEDIVSSLGSAADGLQISCLGTPPTSTNDPMVGQYLADLEAYAPSDVKLDQYGQLGWSGVYLYEQVMKNATSFTGADVIKALNNLTGPVTAGTFGRLTTHGTPVSSAYPRLFSATYVPCGVEDGSVVAKGSFETIPGELLQD